MTFTDISIIYCENDIKHTNALPGKMQNFPVYNTWYVYLHWVVKG
jgi:hypothetical protein